MEIVRYIDRHEDTVRIGLREEGSVRAIDVPDLSDLLTRARPMRGSVR